MRSPPAPSAALPAGPSAGAPASGVGSLPETQEIAVWRSRCRAQKPRNAPQAVGPSRMTRKAEEDAHRPPWEPFRLWVLTPTIRLSGQSHQRLHVLSKLASSSRLGASLQVAT